MASPFPHAAKPAMGDSPAGEVPQPELPLQPEALVLLDVGGMKCGGCSAAVKRMLAARPDVESAAVNLITETAAVRFRWGGRNALTEGNRICTASTNPRVHTRQLKRHF